MSGEIFIASPCAGDHMIKLLQANLKESYVMEMKKVKEELNDQIFYQDKFCQLTRIQFWLVVNYLIIVPIVVLDI